MRFLVMILYAAAVAAAGGCSEETLAPDLPEGGAIVTFAFSATDDTVDVLVLDSLTIARAEARVANGVGPAMPIGPIVRGAGIDPRYPFHYVPEEIRLADLATEVCDGRPMKTAAQVDEFFALSTGNPDAERATWCPWGATPIAVIRR